MKKFNFRLASAMKLRDLQLQSERSKLISSLPNSKQLKRSLEALQQERHDASAFVYGAAGVSATDLRALSSFLLGADARAAGLRAQMQRQTKTIQEQKKRVMEAERAVKLLSKLREKKLEEWNLEFNREIETIAQESWVGNNFIRKKGP